jgi:hypothetical protein
MARDEIAVAKVTVMPAGGPYPVAAAMRAAHLVDADDGGSTGTSDLGWGLANSFRCLVLLSILEVSILGSVCVFYVCFT